MPPPSPSPSPSPPKESTCLLLGNPVDHSLSPLIHNAALKHLDLAIHYEARKVSRPELEAVVNSIDGHHILGGNVTLPYKQDVIGMVDSMTTTAHAVGAVNTIYRVRGRLVGDNTDVTGFVGPLQDLDFKGKTVLILGAGGGARAVAYAALQRLDAKLVLVAARNLETARAINGVEACSWDDRAQAAAEASLIVNATPLGMHPNSWDSPLPHDLEWRSDQVAYDLVYNPTDTNFLIDARAGGAVGIGGLAMLIGQAAASFQLWTGYVMPVEVVKKAVASHLSVRRQS